MSLPSRLIRFGKKGWQGESFLIQMAIAKDIHKYWQKQNQANVHAF